MRGERVAARDAPGRRARPDEYGEALALPADGVVLVTQRLLERRALPRARGRERRSLPSRALYRIGDCVAPRLIADAIFDGHRLAREIDSPDPATPLPYLRERPLPEAAVR